MTCLVSVPLRQGVLDLQLPFVFTDLMVEALSVPA